LEYLIKATSGEDLVLPHGSLDQVLSPHGRPSRQLSGSGDYRMAVDGGQIAFSWEAPGGWSWSRAWRRMTPKPSSPRSPRRLARPPGSQRPGWRYSRHGWNLDVAVAGRGSRAVGGWHPLGPDSVGKGPCVRGRAGRAGPGPLVSPAGVAGAAGPKRRSSRPADASRHPAAGPSRRSRPPPKSGWSSSPQGGRLGAGHGRAG
jgi:hypothetical protein